ncbi:hypothetical protein ACQKBK_07530 [Helicobacter pylori]
MMHEANALEIKICKIPIIGTQRVKPKLSHQPRGKSQISLASLSLPYE